MTEAHTCYVIYDTKTKEYATRRSMTPSFLDARLYKRESDAISVLNNRHKHRLDNLAILPISVTIDPMNTMASVLGLYSANEKLAQKEAAKAAQRIGK
jgi:hypothetical protein